MLRSLCQVVRHKDHSGVWEEGMRAKTTARTALGHTLYCADTSTADSDHKGGPKEVISGSWAPTALWCGGEHTNERDTKQAGRTGHADRDANENMNGVRVYNFRSVT